MKRFFDIGRKDLYPICRSITGRGVVKTLNIIKREFPNLKIKKISSNTKVFDWNIPSEWNVSDAYVVDKNGVKIVDFKKNNLHLISYSASTNKTISKKELFKNLHYLKKQPEAIPYITSYYKKIWGFCISHNQFKEIER